MAPILAHMQRHWLATLVRLALLAPVAWLLLAGFGTTARERLAHNAVVEATLVADAASSACAMQPDLAKRNGQLKALRGNHQHIVTTFVVQEGGADEFGIARGSAITFGDLTPAQSALLLDHAKTVTTAGARALQTTTPLTLDQLQLALPDGQVAVAVPVRKASKGKEVSQVAGAMARVPPAAAPQLALFAAVLALLCAVLALWQVSPRLDRYRDALLSVGFAAVLWMALPALPPLAGPGVTVLSADWMVPHGTATPPAAHNWYWLVAAVHVVAALLGALVQPIVAVLRGMRRDIVPYVYVGPALLATGLLIFVPFALGVGLSFTDKQGNFVGIAHYAEVIASISDANSSMHFGRTLAMTTLWTVLNVGLHVTLGLGLALFLNRPHLRGRKLYRLLLIVPWAVPSYITALTWKWLFNTQYGPLNAMLTALGHDRVDWLGTSAATNFAANLATNVWLGFPFMMVISLGALQSIPAELYEAADIDGGTAWQKFRYVTLPLLKPALFPAVILGTIWTFNAFNVIWLVSGGGPDHQTDILITEAYYTFTVLRRTGLAAAYSVLIFLILLGYTLVTNRLTKATDAVQS